MKKNIVFILLLVIPIISYARIYGDFVSLHIEYNLPLKKDYDSMIVEILSK